MKNELMQMIISGMFICCATVFITHRFQENKPLWVMFWGVLALAHGYLFLRSLKRYKSNKIHA